MVKQVVVGVLVILAGIFQCVAETPREATQKVLSIKLNDQFGKEHTLGVATRRIYFTHDMAGGKLLKAALGENGQALLDSQQAVAITDVSEMPSVIRSMMALPAMKKRSYLIWIDEIGVVVRSLPRKPEQVTVIDLDQMRITAVQFAADKKALEAIIH